MSIFTVVQTVVVIAMIAAVIGVFVPLPIFLGRRLVAIVALVLLCTLGVSCSNKLKTPEEEAAQASKVAAAEAEKRGSYIDVEANPESYLTMAETYAVELGRASISGVLTNSSSYPLGNVKLKCVAKAETGKTLDRYKVTIMRTAKASAETQFGPLNIGYLDPQATGIWCKITDADMLPGGVSPAE